MREGSHYTHTIVLRWSEQEQVYRAEVPAIPGCGGSGHRYEAALASVLDAIRLVAGAGRRWFQFPRFPDAHGR